MSNTGENPGSEDSIDRHKYIYESCNMVSTCFIIGSVLFIVESFLSVGETRAITLVPFYIFIFISFCLFLGANKIIVEFDRKTGIISFEDCSVLRASIVRKKLSDLHHIEWFARDGLFRAAIRLCFEDNTEWALCPGGLSGRGYKLSHDRAMANIIAEFTGVPLKACKEPVLNTRFEQIDPELMIVSRRVSSVQAMFFFIIFLYFAVFLTLFLLEIWSNYNNTSPLISASYLYSIAFSGYYKMPFFLILYFSIFYSSVVDHRVISFDRRNNEITLRKENDHKDWRKRSLAGLRRIEIPSWQVFWMFSANRHSPRLCFDDQVWPLYKQAVFLYRRRDYENDMQILHRLAEFAEVPLICVSRRGET